MPDSSYAPYNPLAIQSIADSLARELLDQPCGPLPPAQCFNGAGIYAIYYRGNFPDYVPIARHNRQTCAVPIYVGKAVPAGARTGIALSAAAQSQTLFNRLAEHGESIRAATHLDLADFSCRYRVIEELFIELAERTLIQRFKPLWNASLSGFGNHDPGSGRQKGKRPGWDEVHPGRSWASRLQPSAKTQAEWLTQIRDYLAAWERGQIGEVAIVDDEDEEASDGE